MDPVLRRKLVVEFVGMFLFMFTVGMATNEAGAGALAPLAIGTHTYYVSAVDGTFTESVLSAGVTGG